MATQVRNCLIDGLDRHRAGDRAAAADRYLAALEIHRPAADAWHLLGVAALEIGLERAVRPLLLASALVPSSGIYLTNLAHGLFRARQAGRALPVAMRARRLAPDHLEARMAEGMAAMALGKAIQASAAFRAVLDGQPDNLAARTNLSVALQALGKVSAALEHAQRSLKGQPDQAAALSAAAACLILLGRSTEAVALQAAAERTSPEAPAVGSNMLFTLAYDETQTSASVAAATKDWAGRHAAGIPASAPVAKNRPGPLRVGYLSQDFRDHPVGRNTLPVIAAHDPKAVSAFVYSLRPQDDIWSAMALKVGGAGRYRDCSGMTDAQVAGCIAADDLDILVTLAGHTAYGLPLVAAHRPAPLQVWWHDLQPSGMSAVDYRISDPVLTGDGIAAEAGDEAPVLLPTFYCHEVPEEEGAVAPLPMLRTGYPVFGSLNNPAKLSEGCLSLWRQVMEAVPDAHLMVKYKRYFQDPGIIDRIKTALGPASERLIVLAADDDRTRHLDVWNRIDVALDPFPFNGSTTSFEALWMGVPVVTLRGDRFVSRVGASLLTELGQPDWIAETPGDYVAVARHLLADPSRLSEIRVGLRDRIRRSALMDPIRHARWMEAAYRIMAARARAGQAPTAITAEMLRETAHADDR
ncbi:MAG: hypothetical protein NXI16_05105 [Alphaproteobacteria bacterium]|nr:hypothetical protein [Alphaproteobacteria bacterium]